MAKYYKPGTEQNRTRLPGTNFLFPKKRRERTHRKYVNIKKKMITTKIRTNHFMIVNLIIDNSFFNEIKDDVSVFFWL